MQKFYDYTFDINKNIIDNLWIADKPLLFLKAYIIKSISVFGIKRHVYVIRYVSLVKKYISDLYLLLNNMPNTHKTSKCYIKILALE